MQDTSMQPTRFPAGKFAVGIALLGAGVLGLTADYELGDVIKNFWPVLLLVAGLGIEVDAVQRRSGGSGGLFLIGVGVWFLIGRNHLFGFTQRTAFPLGVVVVGLGLVAHAFLGITKKGKSHEQQ